MTAISGCRPLFAFFNAAAIKLQQASAPNCAVHSPKDQEGKPTKKQKKNTSQLLPVECSLLARNCSLNCRSELVCCGLAACSSLKCSASLRGSPTAVARKFVAGVWQLATGGCKRCLHLWSIQMQFCCSANTHTNSLLVGLIILNDLIDKARAYILIL